MTKEIIVNPGMPKTGTTTLQNRLFLKHDQYLYLGKHNPGFINGAEEIDHWLLTLKRNLVQKDLEFFKKYNFEDLLAKRFGAAYLSSEKLFLSEEDMLARCITPGKYGNDILIGSAYGIFEKMKMIFENSPFETVKIVLIIRRQDNLIESFFAEEYHNFNAFLGMKSPVDFINYLSDNGEQDGINSIFKYHSLITHIDSLFGRNNVLVLPYELLKMNPELFLNELSAFMQIKPWKNIQLIREKRDNNRDCVNGKGKIAKVRPWRNRLAHVKRKMIGDIPTGLGNRLKFVDKLQRGTVIKLDNYYKRKVLQKYSAENRKLIRRVKYVSEFGYF